MYHLKILLFAITSAAIVHERPLTPAWSPDHQVLATTKVPQNFVTPEGADYSVLFNGRLVYPIKAKHWFSDFNADLHTFLSDFKWSPDSSHVAFVEKVFDWQYSEPFNLYFDGRVSNERFYLTILNRDGSASRYRLKDMPKNIDLRWSDSNEVLLNDMGFNLQSDPPQPAHEAKIR